MNKQDILRKLINSILGNPIVANLVSAIYPNVEKTLQEYNVNQNQLKSTEVNAPVSQPTVPTINAQQSTVSATNVSESYMNTLNGLIKAYRKKMQANEANREEIESLVSLIKRRYDLINQGKEKTPRYLPPSYHPGPLDGPVTATSSEQYLLYQDPRKWFETHKPGGYSDVEWNKRLEKEMKFYE